MADTEKPGHKRVILTIVGIVAVLLVAGCAGFGLRMLQNKNADSPDQGTLVPLPKNVTDAQDLRAQGNLDEAAKKIDAALNSSSTPNDDKALLYIQKGGVLSEQKNYAAAAEAYSQATATKPTSGTYQLLAASYEALGDKAKAIEAYKKAIPLLPNTPVRDEDKAAIEAKIRNLGGEV